MHNRPIPLRWLEWWHYAALLLIGMQLALLVTVQLRPGLLGVVSWYFGSDLLLWWASAPATFTFACRWMDRSPSAGVDRRST
ncbi:MAG: hypothetical protein K8R36_13885 [Planctomycetales bacterium]|nr:hypothetical protein [Planctomycetales bacterium]